MGLCVAQELLSSWPQGAEGHPCSLSMHQKGWCSLVVSIPPMDKLEWCNQVPVFLVNPQSTNRCYVGKESSGPQHHAHMEHNFHNTRLEKMRHADDLPLLG